MATKKEVIKCIELIESMGIQINYRDKIFLNNTNLENPREKKKKPTFSEVISVLQKNPAINLEELEGYDKWFAYYNPEMYFPYEYKVWQYSEKGTVAGITEPVDLNICFEPIWE